MKIKDIEVRPCGECGNTNITFGHCGFSTFNKGWAECECGHKITIRPCSSSPKKHLIEKWNESNPTLEEYIEILEKEIIELKKEIKDRKEKIKKMKK